MSVFHDDSGYSSRKIFVLLLLQIRITALWSFISTLQKIDHHKKTQIKESQRKQRFNQGGCLNRDYTQFKNLIPDGQLNIRALIH